MPRKLRNPKSRREPIPEAVLYLIEFGVMPPPPMAGRTQAYRLLHPAHRAELERLREEFHANESDDDD